ncbi:MAG: hypothetical protein NVS1B3_16800 [Candidatus Dormibacteraceae bacterium]
MTREQFEHVIGAAANVVDLDELVVIGSQAVLGTVAVAPPSMLISMEADVYPLREPERAIEVDGALGDGSPFHRTFGYYAHGVGPETAKLPRGWEERWVRLDVRPRLGSKRKPVAYCPEIHDLVLSKLAAGRERDMDYARQAVAHGLVHCNVLRDRVADLPISRDAQARITSFIATL